MRYFSEIITEWDEKKGPATNYLQKYLKYKQREAFKNIVKEREESDRHDNYDKVTTSVQHDGNEDEANLPFDFIEEEANKEFLADKLHHANHEDHEEAVIRTIDKGMRDKRLMSILEKEKGDPALNAKERQYKKRAVEKLRQEYLKMKASHAIA